MENVFLSMKILWTMMAMDFCAEPEAFQPMKNLLKHQVKKGTVDMNLLFREPVENSAHFVADGNVKE